MTAGQRITALRVVGPGALAVVLGVLTWTIPALSVPCSLAVVVALRGRRPSPRTLAWTLLIWMSCSQWAYVLAWPDWLPPRQAAGCLVAAVVAIIVRGAQRSRPAGRPPTRLGSWVALAAFASAVLWWLAPWLGDPLHVFSRMMLGWDHSGHYAMVEQLRAPTVVGASEFVGYPRGYHALVASLMELVARAPAAMPIEVSTYLGATLVVFAACVIAIAALVLSDRAIADRPALLVAVTACLLTLYLGFHDAGQVTYYGFTGFLEASVFVGAALLLPRTWTQRRNLEHWVLLGLAGAGIVGAWSLLLAIIAPVALSGWLARPRGHGRVPLVGYVLLAALPIVAAMVTQPRIGDAVASGSETGLLARVDTLLLSDGAVATSALAWPVLLPAFGAILPLVVAWRRRGTPAIAARYLVLALGPAAVTGLGGLMLAYEIARLGIPRYFGMKMLAAAMIASSPVGFTMAGVWLSHLRVRFTRSIIAGAVVALVCVLLPGAPIPMGVPLSPGGATRALLASDTPDARAPLAASVFKACERIAGVHGEYYLLMPGRSREDLVRAGVWIISCGQNWIADQPAELRRLLPDRREDGGETIIELPVYTARILASRPDARVLVPQVSLMDAAQGLTGEQASRLIGI